MGETIKMKMFSELTVDELAEHAFNVFLYQGRHPLGARLIYETLRRDPHHALGLRCLADILNQEGLEVFSAITLEYALIYAITSHGSELNAFSDMLFYSKFAWGFSSHSTGKTNLQLKELEDKASFTFDHKKYQDFIDQVIERSGSLEAAFNTALRVCGVMAQFLEHKEVEKTAEFKELFDGSNFILNSEYTKWLNHYEPKLDELMKRRFFDGLNQVST